jgi:adenosylhomocysteine nucleosidase
VSRIAIIAAMERELSPLVRGWRKRSLASGGRNFPFFERDGVLAVVSGIGCKNAEQAARAVVQQHRPELLISVGLAGALIRSLKVGSVFIPSVVVDSADGAEYRCAADSSHVSGGVLVSAAEIAGAEQKRELVNRFHGLVVDMEAAAVARVAQQENLSFRCVKAISDEADFLMPPMERFLNSAGDFESGKFAAWAALRPWQWARVVALARNSKRATLALCDWLQKDLTATGLQSREVATLDGAEFSEVKR